MPVSSGLPDALIGAGWSWHPLGDRGFYHLTPPVMRANARAACGHPLFTGRGWRHRHADGNRTYCRECVRLNGGRRGEP
jgi:hypothetical protein